MEKKGNQVLERLERGKTRTAEAQKCPDILEPELNYVNKNQILTEFLTLSRKISGDHQTLMKNILALLHA